VAAQVPARAGFGLKGLNCMNYKYVLNFTVCVFLPVGQKAVVLLPVR